MNGSGTKPDVIDRTSWPGSIDVVSNKGDLVQIRFQSSAITTNSMHGYHSSEAVNLPVYLCIAGPQTPQFGNLYHDSERR